MFPLFSPPPSAFWKLQHPEHRIINGRHLGNCNSQAVFGWGRRGIWYLRCSAHLKKRTSLQAWIPLFSQLLDTVSGYLFLPLRGKGAHAYSSVLFLLCESMDCQRALVLSLQSCHIAGLLPFFSSYVSFSCLLSLYQICELSKFQIRHL